jgi:hypothetical protein
MPYEIKKSGSGYALVNKETGKVKSHHSTKGKAQASAYFSEHGEAEGRQKFKRAKS